MRPQGGPVVPIAPHRLTIKHHFRKLCDARQLPAAPGAGLDEWYYIWYNKDMTTITTSQARAQLFNLVDATVISHRPVQIKGRRASAVLVSSEDWEAIQETLYLLSVPGMRESLVKNMKSPVAKCSKKLPW